MKKKILILSVFVIIAVTAVAFAAESIIETKEKSFAHQRELVKEQMHKSVEKKTKNLTDKANKYDFCELLRSKGYYEDEVNEIVYSFMQMQAVYSLTDDELKDFYKLTKQDYDLLKLMEIFEFTIHTDYYRDMKFVKQLYDTAQSMEIISDYWVETAFNALTDRTDSILDQSQVVSYIKDGLTVDEIYAANIMSRRSNKTIKNILKTKKSGKQWSDIAEEIYPELTKPKNQEIQEDAVKIVSAVMKSRITGIEAAEIISDSTTADQLISEAQTAAHSSASSIGVSNDELTESILKFAQDKLPSVNKKDLAKWLRKGHRIRDIEQKFIESQKDGTSLEQKINEEVE